MPALRITLDIAAEPGVLFALTQDYSQRLCWDPFLREARLLNGATTPKRGVRAWCVARIGLGMETEYISWQPPRVTAVKMTRGPRFLSSFAGSWRFEPLASGMTRVVFTYHLAARPRWLGWPLQHLFAYDTRRRLHALAESVTTPCRSAQGST